MIKILWLIFLFLSLFLQVNCIAKIFEIVCKQNPNISICQDLLLRAKRDSSLHFRTADDRLIDSNERQLDSSIEYEKARKSFQDNDFSNFATLFDKPDGLMPEVFSKPDKPKPEPFTNSTKKEVDTINSELPEETNPKYCSDYSENFAFYCDQAISLVAKSIRPFCVSYIANCPKQSQALARQR